MSELRGQNRAQILRGNLYMVGTAVMFASAFVATKYTVDTVPPMLAAALRFIVAAVVLSVFAARQARLKTDLSPPGPQGTGRPVEPPDRWRIPLLGLLGIFGYNSLFFWALQFTSASLSALIIPTTLPLMTALLARVMLGESLGPYSVAGVAVATVGVVLAIGQGPAGAEQVNGPGGAALAGLVGPAALLAAVVCFAAYSVIGYGPVKRYGALRTTTYATVIGAALLSVTAASEWSALPTVSAGAWAAIVFMGAGSSALGLVWHYHGVALLGPGRAAGFLYLVPLFAVSGSVVWLGEAVRGWQLGGAVFIVLGVALVQRRTPFSSRRELVRAAGGKR